MGQFKDLLLSIQERLATVPELKYIDKDWGQLRYEQPAVKYPCALIDLEQAGFSETGKGGQLADVSVTITIADQRLTPTSLYAPPERRRICRHRTDGECARCPAAVL